MTALRKIILVGDRVRLPDGRIGEVVGPRDYSRSDRYPVRFSDHTEYHWAGDLSIEVSVSQVKQKEQTS